VLALQQAYIRAGFGEREYHNATNLNAVGALAVLVAIAAALRLGRTRALFPLLILACFVPTGQRVAILTLDFNLIRLLLLAYGARILIRGDFGLIRWNLADRLILCWAACRLMAYTTLHASSKAFVFQAGQLYDFLGLYFVARTYLRTWDDVRRAFRLLAVISVPVAGLFMVEHTSGRNLFSAMGGVPEFTTIRDGRLRCQGPYEHPILAGAFWATLIPLFIGLARSTMRGDKRRGLAGVTCSLIVVFACSSSTPLIGLGTGCALSLAFALRRHAATALAVLTAGLTVVHFAREAPVWQLIAKAGVVGGSTATYRYRLIDAFIRNWSEWLLVGTKGTAHWGYYLFDLTNQYVVEGVRGGSATLLCFMLVLAVCLRRAWRRSIGRGAPMSARHLCWHTTAALGGMAVMFLGISITHSNQTTMVLMLLLAATQARPGAARSRPRPVSASSTDRVQEEGHPLP
jgi:hypothetical protein